MKRRAIKNRENPFSAEQRTSQGGGFGVQHLSGALTFSSLSNVRFLIATLILGPPRLNSSASNASPCPFPYFWEPPLPQQSHTAADARLEISSGFLCIQGLNPFSVLEYERLCGPGEAKAELLRPKRLSFPPKHRVE